MRIEGSRMKGIVGRFDLRRTYREIRDNGGCEPHVEMELFSLFAGSSSRS